MELIDIIRSEYGYQDEYILDKTFLWLYNSCELIRRRRYNEKVESALLIGRSVAMLFSKDVKIQTYDELTADRNEGRSDVPEDFIAPDSTLKALGMGVIKS